MPLVINCFALLVLASLTIGQAPIIQVEEGQIQGGLRSTGAGVEFYAYVGIPYAQPPIGDLRFQPPVAADSWNGVLDVSQDPVECVQPEGGSEDCLFVSVYTPTKLSSNLLPVYIFIHGGAFFMGSMLSTKYGPDYFIDQNSDLIVVMLSYRLGAFGFLSTGDAAASGNFGLLDQNLALKWIKNNIQAFGGDPDDITLTGESAGGVSLLCHMLSPMSDGLFNRAITESGSALVPWGIEENPLPYAQQLAQFFDCPTDDNSALVDCLRQQDAQEIALKQMEVEVEGLTLAFVPVIENPITGRFLTQDPKSLLEQGKFSKVPIILGFNRDEGVLIYEFVPFLFETIDDNFFNEVVPFALTILTDYRTNLINVSWAIKDVYYSDIDLNDAQQVARTSIDLLSDMFMKSWVVETINLIAAQNVPTYMFTFNYEGDYSSTHFTGGNDISHAGELKYLYNETGTRALSDRDFAFSEQFVSLWSNFAVYGDPTPSGSFVWPTTATDQTLYAILDEQLSTAEGYDVDRMNFWNVQVPQIVNA